MSINTKKSHKKIYKSQDIKPIYILFAVFITMLASSFIESAIWGEESTHPPITTILFFAYFVLLIIPSSFWKNRSADRILKKRHYADVSNFVAGAGNKRAIVRELGYNSEERLIERSPTETLYDVTYGPVRAKQSALGVSTTTKGHTNEYYTVFEQKLSRKLPHVLFDSKHAKNEQFAGLFADEQVVTMDVNFDDYFTVYKPYNYHIDTLSFISPDVLQAMLEMKDADFEIIDDTLYAYGPLQPNEQLEDFKELACRVKANIEKNIDTYKDIRINGDKGREDVYWASKSLIESNRSHLIDFAWLGFSLMFTLLFFVIFYLSGEAAGDNLLILLILLGGVLLAIAGAIKKFINLKREERQKIEALKNFK